MKVKLDENLPSKLAQLLAALTRRIHAVFQSEPVETWSRAFVVVTDHKLRVRRPPMENF